MENVLIPTSQHLREVLLHLYLTNISAAESHRVLVETYREYALSETTCRDWFRRFKRNDFNLNNKERGKPPLKFKDKDLQTLLMENDLQTQRQLGDALNVGQAAVSKRLQAMGMVLKDGRWVNQQVQEQEQQCDE